MSVLVPAFDLISAAGGPKSPSNSPSSNQAAAKRADDAKKFRTLFSLYAFLFAFLAIMAAVSSSLALASDAVHVLMDTVVILLNFWASRSAYADSTSSEKLQLTRFLTNHPSEIAAAGGAAPLFDLSS